MLNSDFIVLFIVIFIAIFIVIFIVIYCNLNESPNDSSTFSFVHSSPDKLKTAAYMTLHMIRMVFSSLLIIYIVSCLEV